MYSLFSKWLGFYFFLQLQLRNPDFSLFWANTKVEKKKLDQYGKSELWYISDASIHLRAQAGVDLNNISRVPVVNRH